MLFVIFDILTCINFLYHACVVGALPLVTCEKTKGWRERAAENVRRCDKCDTSWTLTLSLAMSPNMS
jgi:hypothetical protein